MRKIAVRLLVPALLLAAGWSALWVLAAHEAGERTQAWITAEAGRGRDWSCPDRQIGGYPFALRISCDRPSYSGQAMGQHVQASLAGATASVSLGSPRHLVVTLQPPFAFKTSDGATDVEGGWRSLALDLATLPDIRMLALRGSDVAVGGTFVGANESGRADALDARATLLPDDANPTLAFAVSLKAAILPQIDDLLGGTAPVDASLGGRLHHADVGDVQTPAQAMERWRLNGGRLDVDRFAAARAAARMTATGTVRLDDGHRPRGKLDAEFFGLEPILARYGISGNLVAVGSLVSTLFGGGPRKAPATPGSLALPITLGNGHLGIGPVTTGIELTPLY